MKKILVILFLCQVTVQLFAQSYFERGLDDKVIFFYEKFHPESMMIHFNTDAYFSGEMVWYNMYLYNVPYSANHLSTIAYVELWKNQQMLCRQKLKLVNGVAAGDFSLPQNLSTGYYQVKGYTTWMKNLGEETFFKHDILVINPENYSSKNITPPSGKGQSKEDSVFVLKDEKEFVSITARHNEEGVVSILNNGRVMLVETLKPGNSGQEFRIQKSQLLNNTVQAGLFTSAGELISEKNFIVNMNTPSITTNKKRYSPRDRMSISINTPDQQPHSYSINVRSKNQSYAQLSSSTPNFISWKFILNSSHLKLEWPKEKIIFPKSSSTLEPVAMSIQVDSASNKTMATIDNNLLKTITRNELMKQVSESYGIQNPIVKSSAHSLPYDIVYYPKDFVVLPTLEDFFVEIVPQVRAKKIKRVKNIRIRNTENSNKVYFFPKSPMIVVDGVLKYDALEILAMDPQEVNSIHVAFKLNTINSSGIAGLADNGILSIYTKKNNVQQDDVIYKGFYVASTFTSPSYARSNSDKDVVPDLRSQTFWNSSLKGTDKTGTSFFLSDDLGEFIIEVRGIGSDGSIMKAEETFEVGSSPN